MAFSRAELVADVDNGRNRMGFGNLVLCMDWVKEMVEKYDGVIENMTENLTIYEENPEGGMKNPVADTSVVIAKLERYMGTLES
jgi:hypothetical protein